MTKTDILIIGGGLTGLTLNHLLQKQDKRVTLIEARNRLGGRIHTVHGENGTPIEMGATWLGQDHHRLHALLESLDLNIFEQKMGDKAIYEPNSMSPHQVVMLPPNQPPSYRIEGGTSALITSLADTKEPSPLHLNMRVQTISESKNGLLVHCEDETFEAGIVVSTLPPKLLDSSINIEPNLPEEVQALIAQTHTWMGESIKFGLSYSSPFWREKNTSGTLFSNVGPITEMYDHSDPEDKQHALKGFLNSSYFSASRKERLDMVIAQLRKYFGDVVNDYLSYHETVWANESFTYAPYHEHVLPHQNNGHNLFQKPCLNGKLYLAGAETSSVSPGYMDGAVHSAESIYAQLIKKF